VNEHTDRQDSPERFEKSVKKTKRIVILVEAQIL